MPLDGEDAGSWGGEDCAMLWWSAFSSPCCVVKAIARVLLDLRLGLSKRYATTFTGRYCRAMQPSPTTDEGQLFRSDAAKERSRRRGEDTGRRECSRGRSFEGRCQMSIQIVVDGALIWLKTGGLRETQGLN
jgi:hypothetical protein